MVGDLLQAVIGNIGYTDATLGCCIHVYTVITGSGGADDAALMETFYNSSGEGSGEGNGDYCISVMRSGDNLIFALAGDNI